jgi:hypothetical protein
MRRILRKGVVFTLVSAGFIFLPVAPAAADPVLMFLIGMARDMVTAHANDPRSRIPTLQLPDMGKVYPGTTVEPDHIRRLIDDSFLYLSTAQRREIFDSMNNALLDPKNAAVRGAMIEHFASKALTVRAAQLKLAQLPWREKERLAGEFKRELVDLSVEDRAHLGELLRSGLLPVPNDLNQLLLTAFEEG